MDQGQDRIDPEVAQELIALLNKKIANLRHENAQLQVRRGQMPRNRSYAARSDLNPTESTEWGSRKGGRRSPWSFGR